jgi:hypothetical protein
MLQAQHAGAAAAGGMYCHGGVQFEGGGYGEGFGGLRPPQPPCLAPQPAGRPPAAPAPWCARAPWWGRRRSRHSRVGVQHRLTREDAIKWFQTKFEGVVLNKAHA